MKKIRITFSILLLALVTMNSCHKNFSDERYAPAEKPIIPDFITKVVTSVNGYVVDENNKPVFHAQVITGTKDTLTDEYGYFSISNTSVPKDAATIKVVSGGYFTGYRSFTVLEGKQTFIRIQLVPKTNAGAISAGSGGAVTNSAGAKVELPADGVVLASDNSAYTGTINVAVSWLDPSATSNLQLSAPGDFRGIDTAGHLKYTQSRGAIAVELTNASGQLLQVAPGKKATITIPIPAAMIATAPSSIKLWSLDETTGLWKQEATAVKNGNAYTGSVGHFSYWEGAEGLSVVNFAARVLDASLHPVANAPVVITPANAPQQAGYGKFSYTDADGYVYGAIPANSNLVLDVMTTCATSAYSHPFSTGSNDIDLGAITGNVGQGLVTISGTVVNCSSTPVTNGYVQTYDNGFYNRIPVVNGNFSFTGLACTNTTINYVAVDKNTNQQNAPQSITLVPGVNDLGQLTACGISTIGVFTYSLDGGAVHTLTEPATTPTGYYLGPQNPQTTQIIVINSNGNPNPDLSFQMDGGLTIGNGHTMNEIFADGFESGRGWAPVPLVINITEYGNVGGFIAGSFSGLVLDFASNAQHNIECNFRVRRFR